MYHSSSLIYPIALLLKIAIPMARLVFTLQQPIFSALFPTIAQLLPIPTMVQTSIHAIISWKLVLLENSYLSLKTQLKLHEVRLTSSPTLFPSELTLPLNVSLLIFDLVF